MCGSWRLSTGQLLVATLSYRPFHLLYNGIPAYVARIAVFFSFNKLVSFTSVYIRCKMRITEELLRRKAEHHDGVLADLEEITLHQLEIEKIEVIGSVCRKLRILYLQNNIISKLEGLYHLKDLRYLNMALNNVTRAEGLSSCEFLNKLDFTVNFIDVDELEASMEHLSSLLHLRELYMMGNPCTTWDGFRPFTICMLPQLQLLDGSEVSRTERIQAQQRWKSLRAELRQLANDKRVEKGLPQVEQPVDPDDDTEPWTPEARVRMYRELAEQKAEQEKSRRGNEPQDRNYAREQAEAVERTRQREAEGQVRQCNEGRWEFSVEDEDGEGNCVLKLRLSRFLDTSLVDVDVHPTYVSVIIKGKVFRILWPDEVRSNDGKCLRSQTTGELMIRAPKVKQSKVLAELRRKDNVGQGPAGRGSSSTSSAASRGPASSSSSSSQAGTSSTGNNSAVNGKPKSSKLADELLEVGRAVSITGITTGGSSASGASGGYIGDGHGGTSLFRAGETSRAVPLQQEAGNGQQKGPALYGDGDVDESEVPPLE